MKKFRSMLAIVLILTCLLSLLVACSDKVPDKEDYVTQPADDTDEKKDIPLTEKDKENIFRTAMSYLKALNFDGAYDELIKIPDYVSDNNTPVADYLARFHYEYTIGYLYDNDNIDYTFCDYYTYDDYGFHTSYIRRNTQEKEQTQQTLKYAYENGILSEKTFRDKNKSLLSHHYIYDETTGLLLYVNETPSGGTRVDKINTLTYDDANRLTGEVWTDKNGKLLSTVDYEYNAQGLVAKRVDTTVESESTTVVETTYTYNQKGLVATEKSTDEIGAYTITYTYNDKGQITKEVLSYTGTTLGSTSIYTYDDLDRLYTKETTITEMVTDAETQETAPATRIEKYFYEKYKLFYNPYV